MFDTQKFIEDRKVEKFDNFKFQYNSEFSQFNANDNMVIFFDLESNHTINQYIKTNLEAIKQRFKDEYKNFVYLPSIVFSEKFDTILKYYLPHLSESNYRTLQFENIFQKPENQKIVDYLGYSGTIKCGLIFINEATIVECNEFLIQDNFFTDSLLYFKTLSEQRVFSFDDYDDMIDNIKSFNPYENLDDDALAKINEIQKQLSELKQNGQLLFALPILKEILENETNTIDFNSENNLLIDEDFRILLPNFNNIEIQLSHLTKAVYMLFYNNPKGINIKKLYQYKQQIISLYAGISNQLDYDKMLQSIDDLVKPDSKAIYTHISRIKSAFYKQMDYKFADKFIVTSANFGNDFKFIPILKDKIVPIQELKETDELFYIEDNFDD
ncbi:conserved hypothetical protein [Flavobacterium psychrophilum]|uniref:hypothetical protein n=1 Tax=Flavobacterium psychrophilum TaxID=96345 RepID=UPI000B7C3277|nr:hypothetical protein [Flavobacterium psychrophilum]MCB6062369.1 hypothetical protein [Flavobacterium psychrophilum]SNB42325.1 conserved hypothetical protein [Flavobacterium psychrophilum]